MILVVGATGELGGLISQRLLEKGQEVRVLVRRPSPHEHLATAGAALAMGDLKDPASLVTACQGVDVVVTTANSVRRGGDDTVETVDRRGVPQWIELDKKAMKGTVKSVPNREDLTMPIQEQLIVELYSK